MSTLADELRLMRGGLGDRVAQARRAVERITPGPLLVRLVGFAAAAGALGVAYAPVIRGGLAVPVIVVVALLPVVAPRTPLATWVLFGTVFGWLLSAAAYTVPIGAVRLMGLAALLYLMHAATALAAVLPYDAVVAPSLLVRWFGRAVGVVVVSELFAFALIVLTQGLGDRTYLLASLAGLAAAVGLAVLLARAHRARD